MLNGFEDIREEWSRCARSGMFGEFSVRLEGPASNRLFIVRLGEVWRLRQG